MIGQFLTWYLTMQVFALVGLPLAFVWLRRLRSRGYAVAKALGLLLTGVVVWWGGILHLWENTMSAMLVAAGFVFGVGMWALWRHRAEVRPWLQEQGAFILTTEILFLAALLLWTVVRASQSQLETAGGEKWMEIAFLNAVLRSSQVPPHDPWLSGYAISYYYLGYFLLGTLTRLSALPSTVAFNLGCAGWFALAAVGAYGVVYDLLERRGVLRSLFAPLLLLLTGNAEGLLEVFHARGLFPERFWVWLDIRHLNTAPQPPFSWIPTRFFWWWQGSRVLADYAPWGDRIEIIDEFPAFSFTLGDMHPHVLVLPFTLLVIALALNLYRTLSEGEFSAKWLPHLLGGLEGDARLAWLARLVPMVGYALALGALAFINTWDFPIYWALMVGGMVLARYAHPKTGTPTFRQMWVRFFDALWNTLPEAFVLGVLSVLLYFPFWYALRSQAGGALPNLFNATRWPQFVVMFAPLLIPLLGVIAGAARDASVSWKWVLVGGVGLMVAIALLGLLVGAGAAYPYLQSVWRGEPIQGLSITPEMVVEGIKTRWLDPWVGLTIAFAVAAVVLALLKQLAVSCQRSALSPQSLVPSHESPIPDPKSRIQNPKSPPISYSPFILLLVLIGLLLTLAPEYVYLKDMFTSRMNTIFKFYFQAWILWSLAGAWQIARWLEPRDARREERFPWRALAVGLSCLLIAVGLLYTILAVPARAREHSTPWTLDGAAWLAASRPTDYAAIRWLNANVEGAPVIVEAPGDQNRAYVYEGRVAALTGLPTVLGWAGHQRQWRGNYDEPARREAYLEMLFTTLDPTEAQSILALYNVSYIYIGPIERERYPAEGLEKFAAMFPVVYEGGDVVIYGVD
jgi:YYY domain-containing protein